MTSYFQDGARCCIMQQRLPAALPSSPPSVVTSVVRYNALQFLIQSAHKYLFFVKNWILNHFQSNGHWSLTICTAAAALSRRLPYNDVMSHSRASVYYEKTDAHRIIRYRILVY